MTSLFPPFNRRSSFRKLPYFFEAGRGVYYKSTGMPAPALDLNFLSGTLDSRITFSRASNATLTDSTGKITFAPNNLLTYSQTFTDASWAKTNATVTASATTAPDGTSTASKLIGTAVTGSHFINKALTISDNAVFSVYLKASEYTAARLNSGTSGQAFASFNLQTGVIASSGGTNFVSAAIQNVGSGWYRCQIRTTGTVGTSGWSIIIENPVGTTSFLGDGASGLFVWGAQLEAVTYQTSPSTYNATTSAAYYGPRFDYDPVTLAAKGLLIEEARTNLVLQSNNFSTSWANTNITITPASGTSPDGTNNAVKIEATGTATCAQIVSSSGSASGNTFSIYAKQGTGATTANRFTIYNSTTAATVLAITFNYSTGAITYVTGSSGASAVNVGNGWWRISLSATTGISAGNTLIVYAGFVGALATAGDYLLAYGAQLEAGAFATSYIPTVAASVARSADLASMTGTNFSSWFNQGPVNLFTYSQTFTDASWVKTNATVTASATTAPDGTSTASKLIGTAVTGSHFINKPLIISDNAVFSVYLKASEYTAARLNSGTSGQAFASFNLQTGVIASSGGTNFVSATIQDVGSGWYRCQIRTTGTVGTSGWSIAIENPVGTTSFLGDGTSGIFVWGAQLEVGSTATTYIPTTTAPVANPPAVGTFVANVSLLAAPSVRTACLYAVSDNTTNQRILVQTGTGSGGNINTLVVTGGVTQAQTVNGSLTSAGAYKYANAFATNDFSSVANGGSAATDTLGTVPTVNRFEIGASGIQTAQLCGTVASIRYYNQRLTNAQLQALTR